jgi:hypothetical protein
MWRPERRPFRDRRVSAVQTRGIKDAERFEAGFFIEGRKEPG